MTRIETETISASETASIAQRALGSLKAWPHFFGDIAKGGGANINGLQLFPCCRQHDGRAYRPRYAVKDVAQFIKDVLATVSDAGKPMKAVRLPIVEGRFWKLNNFNADGSPRAAMR